MASVVVGYISPGDLKTAFHMSMVNILLQSPDVHAEISITSGPRIAAARNDVCRIFMEKYPDQEWLFMVDSDMTFLPDTVQRFLASANSKIRPIVGGLCFGGGRIGVPFPTLYTFVNPKENDGRITKVIRDYPKNALKKVDATGAAALFVHRSVLQAMAEKYATSPDGYPNPHPWFSETVHMGCEYGEDFSFCVRAKQLGYDIFVDTAIKFGHIKTIDFNEEFYEMVRKHNVD